MIKLLVVFLLTSLYLAATPHPSQCLDVTFKKVDSTHYEQYTVNKCNVYFKEVAVLVKFFNKNWERIDVQAFAMYYVAPYERTRKTFEVPPGAVNFAHVGVRAITDKAVDAIN